MMKNDNNKNGNFPTIRFKEFTEAWEVKKLGEVAEIVGGGTPSTSVEEYWKGSIPWISSSDISEKSISIINKTRFVNEKSIKETATKLIPKGAILLVSRVGIGKFAIADENLCTSQDFSNLITTQNSYFLASYFQSKVSKFLNLSQGTSIKGFTTKDIKFIKFSFPKLEEQTKIANFLSKLDERILLQREIITHLETLIKGYRQKLFSQELRFKDENGKDFPNWEEKKLGEVLIEPNQKAEINPNEIELLTVKLHCKGVQNSGKYPATTKRGRPYYKRYENEILIGRQNFHNGGIGIVKSENNGRICSNAITSYSVLNDNLAFIYYFISRTSYYKRVDNLLGGTGQKEISKKEFSKLKINIPILKEQEKNANFLSSLDKKLKTEQELLSAYEQQKKYFLQNMFV